MAKLSMNELTTYRWSFEEDVQHYAAAGIEAIGVWRQKLADFGEEKGIELLEEAGLAVSSLLWAGGFTGSDGRTYKESLEDARDAVRLTQAMRAGCLIVYSGARAGHTHNHARRLLKSALAELVQFAAEKGVMLAVEPMHAGCAAEWTFLTSVDETLELLQAIGSDRLKIAFDTYHFGCDENIVDKIAELAPHVAIVQLGDAKHPPNGEQNRCPLGEGQIPLKQIVAEFKKAGFDGFYDVELIGEEIEASNYESLLQGAKRAFAEM